MFDGAPADDPGRQVVAAEDLTRTIDVIGALHLPIGRMVELKGEILRDTFQPSDYLGRVALVQGTAINHRGSAYLSGPGWRVLVWLDQTWPERMSGKEVETYSVVLQTADGTLAVESPTPRLQHLADQVGLDVELRGTFITDETGKAQLLYRGQSVLLSGTEKLQGESRVRYAQPISVRGRLEVWRPGKWKT